MAWNAREMTGLYAGEDLSAKQGFYMRMHSDGDVMLADGATVYLQSGLGILNNKPESGQPCSIAGPGEISRAEIAGTVAAGMLLMVEQATGKLDPAGATNQVIVAMALEAGATGDTIKVLVKEPKFIADVSIMGIGNA